jgi:hypothetical protein
MRKKRKGEIDSEGAAGRRAEVRLRRKGDEQED